MACWPGLLVAESCLAADWWPAGGWRAGRQGNSDTFKRKISKCNPFFFDQFLPRPKAVGWRMDVWGRLPVPEG